MRSRCSSGFTKRKDRLVFGSAESTFLLVENKNSNVLSIILLFVSVGVHFPAERFKTVKTQSHDRAMPYSNNRTLIMRIIGIIRRAVMMIIIIIIINSNNNISFYVF